MIFEREGSNGFIFKLSSDGKTILFSTYLGGSHVDACDDIAVDGMGNIYVTGSTSSSDFPTVNAKYPNMGGRGDAFVFKLSGDGKSILFSTYLGGSSDEWGSGIAVDDVGNAYVTGGTDSSDFPKVNAKYPDLQGGRDAFITKLSTNGRTVLYSTFLGGSRFEDYSNDIAVDREGNAYVTGWTSSVDFPKVNAIYPDLWGIGDAFVFKLSSDGQTVGYSTYLGGRGDEAGNGIAVDDIGNAYVIGQTRSGDFPTVNAKYPNLRGRLDAFVFKLSDDGKTVLYSTYLGGGNVEDGHGIAVDGMGNAYVTGQGWSSDFPTSATDPNIISYDPTYNGGGDAFIAKLSSDDNATPTERVAVVLVHGITGSWTSFSGDGKLLKSDGTECTETTYPRSYRTAGCLPRFGHLLRQDGKRLVAQPFDYKAKTKLGGSSDLPKDTIPRLAGELHKHIQCVLRGTCMDDGKPVDRVDIVAHSMGGLVTRAYIAGMAIDADNADKPLPYNGKIRRVVTAGTPHYGASFTSAGGTGEKRLADLNAQRKDMEFGSAFLWNLHARWQKYVVKSGRFDSANLLAIAGHTDMTTLSCDEDNNDGIVYLASAVLPEKSLPSSQIRYVPYPHATAACLAFPSLVGVRPEDGTAHETYQFAKAFLQGAQVPATSSMPSADFLNNALLMVRLIDKNGRAIDPAPTFGFNASLRLTDTNGEEIYLLAEPLTNSDGKTLAAERIPLDAGQMNENQEMKVTLWITAPSGYQDPEPVQLTLRPGRPSVQELRLQAK